MNKKKTIQWYRTKQYGNEREFVHPSCEGEAQILRTLTGRSTIDDGVRELLRDLTGGQIVWEEVVAP